MFSKILFFTKSETFGILFSISVALELILVFITTPVVSGILLQLPLHKSFGN